LDKKEDKPNDSTELDKKEDKPNDSSELDKGREKITQDELQAIERKKVCVSTLLSFFGCSLISCKNGLKT
jgi:hypothetical protein